MELFDRLRAVAALQHEEGDFPSRLLAEVVEIADHPELYADKPQLVELLRNQIENYDCYAGAGCFNDSVGAATIGATIGRIKRMTPDKKDAPSPVADTVPPAHAPGSTPGNRSALVGIHSYGGAGMACEIEDCCHFFRDNMQNLPKTAEYIRNKLCFGDYGKCNRYRTYLEFGGRDVPFDLFPEEADEVKRITECLRTKQLP